MGELYFLGRLRKHNAARGKRCCLVPTMLSEPREAETRREGGRARNAGTVGSCDLEYWATPKGSLINRHGLPLAKCFHRFSGKEGPCLRLRCPETLSPESDFTVATYAARRSADA
jgi:hypothetical protein